MPRRKRPADQHPPRVYALHEKPYIKLLHPTSEENLPVKDTLAKSSSMAKSSSALANNTGHRQRLRERFLRDEGKSMADYEILELLLMQVIKRKDVKPLAKQLIQHFGSLLEVLSADAILLQSIPSVGKETVFHLKLMSASIQRVAQQQTLDRHVISSWQGLLDYCRICFSGLPNEEFHAIVMDKQNHVIGHLCLGRGSISDVVVYPREVVKQALDNHAASIVLVHNHPGGSAKPSANDIKTTQKLRSALAAVEISLFDHLIIARGGATVSFKEKGLI